MKASDVEYQNKIIMEIGPILGLTCITIAMLASMTILIVVGIMNYKNL